MTDETAAHSHNSGPRKKKFARHSRKKRLISSIGTLISFALVGWSAVTNVHNSDNAYHSNTIEVIASRQKRIDSLQADIDEKAKQIETLQSIVADSSDSDDSVSSNSADATSASTVLPAIQGAGVTVTLNDSQKWEQVSKDKNANPNDYVVHQQDIEAVVNAMWAGGADAITIQDQRLQPTSAIKCIGNVLLLNGKQYAPPYKISAIGDITELTATINSSETVQIYKQYVEADGLGWTLETSQNLVFQEVTTTVQPLKYATAQR
ncbi:DUF881 domain-containing protein [Alloscardovia criceti]|uniref:DUF881 domain-containing protein n=1 Tax=Alloscardovia criceti TaxID=356828 RepID=UPI00035C0992|nr:DUF881 domain-containing protein [Alloscardovia criceti]